MRTVNLALLLLFGCSDLPRDPDGTLDRVRATHRFRVGLVAGAESPDAAMARRVLVAVAEAASARPTIESGSLEPLLMRLERGDLDLVVGGRFDEKTPWKTRVALGPALLVRSEAAGDTASHVIARNGENAWITLVQRHVLAEGGTR